MFRYETHLHTLPVSRCAKVSVEENLLFYKEIGYAGVFITNHFIDGNINFDKTLPYKEQIDFYFSDYENALRIGDEIGLRVFCGVETTLGGTDFLVYGLDKAWFLAHPQIREMKKSEELSFFIENGALVIQAHPFRQASYIDHIRLFPACVHGVEVLNACRSDEDNEMASLYARHYNLLPFAGTDNHHGAARARLAGMAFDTPIRDEKDFVLRVKNGEASPFLAENPLLSLKRK